MRPFLVQPPGFDPQPTLEGDNLVVRPLVEADREGLYAAARDPLVWAGHPATDRHERAVFDPYVTFLLGTGASLAIAERGGRVIGTSTYYVEPGTAPPRLSIGFTFLARDHWGGATNRSLKALMLGHLFGHADEAWFHIAPSNVRSQRATAKLGARRHGRATLDLGGGPQDWEQYVFARGDWNAGAP